MIGSYFSRQHNPPSPSLVFCATFLAQFNSRSRPASLPASKHMSNLFFFVVSSNSCFHFIPPCPPNPSTSSIDYVWIVLRVWTRHLTVDQALLHDIFAFSPRSLNLPDPIIQTHHHHHLPLLLHAPSVHQLILALSTSACATPFFSRPTFTRPDGPTDHVSRVASSFVHVQVFVRNHPWRPSFFFSRSNTLCFAFDLWARDSFFCTFNLFDYVRSFFCFHSFLFLFTFLHFESNRSFLHSQTT